MKLTRAMKADIMRQVKALTRGHTRITAEIGHRPDAADKDTGNALRWAVDADLSETWPLAEVATVDDSEAHPGLATLDLYVYGHIRGGMFDGEYTLIHNAYVYIRDGVIVSVHTNDLRADKIAQDLGFPHFSAQG